MKKLLLCLLMVVSCAALSGCGDLTAEEIMEKYAENNLSVDNCEASMKMNMELGMEDAEDTLQLNVDSNIQIMSSPEYKAYVQMNMDMGELGNYDMDTYIVKEEDVYYSYMYTSDTWMKQEISSETIEDEIASYSDQINMDVYLQNMQNFTLQGQETVNDKETYLIEGTVSGDSIREILESTDLGDYAGVDMDSYDFSTLGDLQVSFWVAKDDFKPVKIYIDMTSLMADMMSEQGVTVPACTMEFSYLGFDTVTDIELPEEAKDAILLDDETEEDAS